MYNAVASSKLVINIHVYGGVHVQKEKKKKSTRTTLGPLGRGERHLGLAPAFSSFVDTVRLSATTRLTVESVPLKVIELH